MARSADFMATFEAYVDAFPGAWHPDSRSMSLYDFDRMEVMMETALERGAPITRDDLRDPVPEPDPAVGLVF